MTYAELPSRERHLFQLKLSILSVLSWPTVAARFAWNLHLNPLLFQVPAFILCAILVTVMTRPSTDVGKQKAFWDSYKVYASTVAITEFLVLMVSGWVMRGTL